LKPYDSEAQRKAFVLHQSGKDYVDISKAIGCSVATVGRLLQREKQQRESRVQSKAGDLSQVFRELVEMATLEFESSRDIQALSASLRAWEKFFEMQSGGVNVEPAPAPNLTEDEFLLMAAYTDQRNRDLGLLRSDGKGFDPQALRRYFGFAPGFNERTEPPEDLS